MPVEDASRLISELEAKLENAASRDSSTAKVFVSNEIRKGSIVRIEPLSGWKLHCLQVQ